MNHHLHPECFLDENEPSSLTLCVLRATSQVLLFPVHCQVRALQLELSTELKMSKENKSSTEVESSKELNLSYTIVNLYIPGVTNTQQHPAASPWFWVFFQLQVPHYHGNQLLVCQAWPWPSTEGICPCYTCLEPDREQATSGSCLKLN